MDKGTDRASASGSSKGDAQIRANERARIVALIRREARQTFDMKLDFEFRQLADLIERDGAQS